MTTRQISCGLLMFKIEDSKLYIYIIHPGGPFFKNKDNGYWSIPKGLYEEKDSDKRHAALREFMEETGIEPKGELIELGQVEQQNNKTVYAWAFEGEIPDDYKVKSNTFKMIWPPNSNNLQEFPEIDKGQYFETSIAKTKLNQAQSTFVDRLKKILLEKGIKIKDIL